jgi:hypothetical protein
MAGFRKTTDEVKALFSELTEGMDGERRPMFGCPCLFLHGNMVMGTCADRIFFRVPREGQAAMLAAHPLLRQFEPMAGRPMRDYLDLEAVPEVRTALADFLAQCWMISQSLPPKEKAAKKGRPPHATAALTPQPKKPETRR